MPASCRLSALTAVFAALLAFCFACSPVPLAEVLPESDLRPPSLVAAGPESEKLFLLSFDEEVSPVAASFGLEPSGGPPEPGAPGKEIRLSFPEDLVPGRDYDLAGEVEDGHGNRTRFVLSFVGYNARLPELRLSELQTGKNSSSSNPHRDFIEVEALSAGNLGGIEVSWASSVKVASMRLPSAEVKAGDFFLIHLAPEGLPEEKDEGGADLAFSGGVDSSAQARDFWSGEGGLPDSTGFVCLKSRPGGDFLDACFYVEEGKTGAIPEGKLLSFASEAMKSGAWPQKGGQASYEDGFPWKPSSSRSLCRYAGAGLAGEKAWYVSGTGCQSPGSMNLGPEAKAVKAKKTRTRRGP